MNRIPFPDVMVSEATVMRPYNPPGLFAYRHVQADHLLRFPDLANGNLTKQQRKEALSRLVNTHRPLAALVIFLNVVALEDFVRDLATRLADVPVLLTLFPRITRIRPILRTRNPTRPYARLDDDPASLTDFVKVNELFQSALGVAPFVEKDLPKLYDLALLRHTVAHNGALVRPIDVSRFQFWELRPNQLINPPVEFVREIAHYVYQIGRDFELSVRNVVFSRVLGSLPGTWQQEPPPELESLIELFDYFGKLPKGEEVSAWPWEEGFEAKKKAGAKAAHRSLIQDCVGDLRDAYPPAT